LPFLLWKKIKMLKKFSAGFVLVATLTMCMGIVNTAFVNFASASEGEKMREVWTPAF